MQSPPSERRYYLFVASDFGVLVFEQQTEGWIQTRAGLEGKTVTSVATRFGAVLAGTRDGIFRSVDLGQTWWPYDTGLAERHVRWLAYHPDASGRAFAGTEPAMIFISHADEDTWHGCHEVAALRDEHGWYLPYSPEAGCVRAFAFHGSRGYAAVEQGGLLRTDSRGETWRLVGGSDGEPRTPESETMIHPDLHSVEVHPSSASTVIAPTGGGLYFSQDGGDRWQLLYRCYCRAVWVDPGRSDHMILGPADGVDRHGRIEETINGGQTWELRMTGLPDAWPNHMVERFLQVENELMAVLSNGQLIVTSLDALVWQELISPVQEVNAVAALMG